jgi:hypothetical protein
MDEISDGHCLCLGGWHDELCMMRLVALGFRYMLYLLPECVLCIVISRKIYMFLFLRQIKVLDGRY